MDDVCSLLKYFIMRNVVYTGHLMLLRYWNVGDYEDLSI